jgi:hypothetical protein
LDVRIVVLLAVLLEAVLSVRTREVGVERRRRALARGRAILGGLGESGLELLDVGGVRSIAVHPFGVLLLSRLLSAAAGHASPS